MQEGVLKAIREYQRAKEIVLIACSKHYQTKAWRYIDNRNQTQSVIAGKETVPTAVGKWKKGYEELN